MPSPLIGIRVVSLLLLSLPLEGKVAAKQPDEVCKALQYIELRV